MSAPPITREETATGAFAALANKVFARYLTVLTMSLAGNWIRVTAMGYLVYDITGDPFKLGLISFAQSFPQVLLSPVAGAVIDRMNRRTVLTLVQVALISMMTLLTVLVVTDRVTYEWLLGIAIVVGCAMTFDWPARLSIVPALVERRELPSAVALNAAAFNGARVVGPSIAGFLIAWLGMGAAFGITTLSALPFLVVLFSIAAFRPAGNTATRSTEHPVAALMDGYRYIWRNHDLRAMLSVDVVPIILGMSYVAMAPAIAADVLGLGSQGFGLMLTIGGIGSLTGTLAVAHLSRRSGRGKMVLVAITIFAVGLIAYGLSSSVWLTFPLMVVLGMSYALSSTMNDTLIQMRVDDAYRGRVMAVYSTFWGLSPAGGLLAGYLANHIGVQWAVAINGILVLCYVPWLLFRTPMRHID